MIPERTSLESRSVREMREELCSRTAALKPTLTEPPEQPVSQACARMVTALSPEPTLSTQARLHQALGRLRFPEGIPISELSARGLQFPKQIFPQSLPALSLPGL